MLDDPMELSDENTKEVDQSSQEQFIEKTLAESLEEYYKLIDEAADLDITDNQQDIENNDEDLVEEESSTKDLENDQNEDIKTSKNEDEIQSNFDEKMQNTLNNDQNVLEKVDILSTQKAESLEPSEENNKNLEDSEKSLELTGESTEISNSPKKITETAPENTEKNTEVTEQNMETLEQNAEHAVKNMEDSKENLQGMTQRTYVPRPVTVRRTMYRPISVFRRPIVRRTAIIERSPIVRRTIVLPVASPTAPNSTPATVVKRPAVTPVAHPSVPNSTPATVVKRPAVLPAPVIHRTTIINPRPAVRRQTIIHQSSPSCRAGFYWAWTNPRIRSGKCVKDYENNCEEYGYDHGMCHKCFAGFIKTKTQYGDYFCLKQGATMPDLNTLRKGDKAYNRLHRDDSMTWFIWLLIIVVMIIAIGIITRCICNRRKAGNIKKGNKFKDLDSAEFYNMGEPNSPF